MILLLLGLGLLGLVGGLTFLGLRQSRGGRSGPTAPIPLFGDELSQLQKRLTPWAPYRLSRPTWAEGWSFNFRSAHGDLWRMTYRVYPWSTALSISPAPGEREWVFPPERDQMGKAGSGVWQGPALSQNSKADPAFHEFVRAFLVKACGWELLKADLEAWDLQCQILEALEVLAHYKYFFGQGEYRPTCWGYTCYDCGEEWLRDFRPSCSCLWDNSGYTAAATFNPETLRVKP